LHRLDEAITLDIGPARPAVSRQYDRFVGRRGIICALLAALILGGCKEEPAKTPSACLDGPDAIQTALAKAPGEVTLDGTKLSDCFVKTGDTGDITSFGGSVLDVMTRLGVEAKENPGGPALVQLGYLRGALVRGADPGIHDELLRRIDQELLLVETDSPEFRRGEAAGRESG
jgi:hypothetical protein